ncbi:DUF4440 domain-containing protein [uncultured Pseudomonas sp.]|uniref:nuclear transport factor 2 family protein n=1 Tax=uncultured Pseudomonas sp. TaxID=114707 RepID=UPI0025E8CC50|nr:DUF4440 domain-containing protein [uncultured Pseudomonas sp.]
MDELLEKLRGLEVSLHAGQRHCRDWLEQVLHPEFSEITRSGAMVSREQTIDALVRESSESRFVATDFQLTFADRDSALLRYRTSHSDGGIAQRSSYWVRLDVERWTLIFHQGTTAMAGK